MECHVWFWVCCVLLHSLVPTQPASSSGCPGGRRVQQCRISPSEDSSPWHDDMFHCTLAQNPYEFIGILTTTTTEPYEFIGFRGGGTDRVPAAYRSMPLRGLRRRRICKPKAA